eukprot:jgi/Chlat1/1515/Chrsp12S02080
MLPTVVSNNRLGPLLGTARFSLQACGGVRERCACCVRDGVASSALAFSRLQHQQRQSKLQHLHHAIVPSVATARSTTVVRAIDGGNSGCAKTFAGAGKPGELSVRKYKLDHLERLCSANPRGISVIHGPVNRGTTKVLKAFVK